MFTFVLLLFSYTHRALGQEGMGSVTVVVQDFYSGDPIERAQILITPCNYTGSTESNGEAVFDNIVPFRNYQIEVTAENYIDAAIGFVSVEALEETVSLVPLKEKATLSGHVTMELLFEFLKWPLWNASVKLQAIEDKSFVTIGEFPTDFWGWYTFENLDEGRYRITIQADGFTSEYMDVEVEGGKDVTQDISVRWQWLGNDSLDNLRSHYPHGTTLLSEDKVYPSSTHLIDNNKMIFAEVCQPPRTPNEFYSVPEAVPSVIPGPSEVPYLYQNQVFTSTSGSTFVEGGATVYLRGFAIDQDLPSPFEFNPDAPCFDIYENKNGNFSASVFSYSWTLHDSHQRDYTSLLTPSPFAENVSFTIPVNFKKGDYLIASLSVTDDQEITGTPAQLTIVVAERVDDATCAGCHLDIATGYLTTTHAHGTDGAACQDCHGLGSEHPASGKLTVSYWSGVCGQCHREFAELQKANHSDPLPFGYYEPSEGRLTICYKCHYTPGYIGAVASDTPFPSFHYDEDTLAEIPRDTPNVSCSVCHDPHHAGEENPYGLRMGSAGTACDTCHYEKWQNAILEGIGGTVGNAYHYPGEDYTPFLKENNPHRTDDKCVYCHMDTRGAANDENGVLKIGGHTFRMRDYGTDAVPGTNDDTLNITVCQDCHAGVSTFDRNGMQSEVQELLTALSNLLKGNNHGFLPANEPGNCARCHKGGTVPFLDDPDSILEHAYTNYKLIINDRSQGIHNPGYVKKLLQDSITSVQNTYNFSRLKR
jgi:hypothetical protein